MQLPRFLEFSAELSGLGVFIEHDEQIVRIEHFEHFVLLILEQNDPSHRRFKSIQNCRGLGDYLFAGAGGGGGAAGA